MTCFHRLQATNPWSFQGFDLKCKLEKQIYINTNIFFRFNLAKFFK